LQLSAYLLKVFRCQLLNDLARSHSLLNGCNLEPPVQILSDVNKRFCPALIISSFLIVCDFTALAHIGFQ